MTWPTNSPAVQPTTHDQVAAQAYSGVGGDYFRSGYYNHGCYHTGATASIGALNGYLWLRPFVVPTRRTFDRIGVTVSTAATAGGLLRMGIYQPGPVPSSLLLDAGTVATTTTGAKEVAISLALNPGVYWVGGATQGAACNLVAYGNGGAMISPYVSVDTTTVAAGSNFAFAFFSNIGQVTGLPATLGSVSSASSQAFCFQLRAA